MFDRVLSHARLMDRMLERIGAETGRAVRIAHGAAWEEARTQCLVCPDARRCRDWLDANHPLTPAAGLLSQRAALAPVPASSRCGGSRSRQTMRPISILNRQPMETFRCP